MSIKNLIWQFSGQGTGKIFMFLFYILLPLIIGAEEYGKFAYALALSSIVVQPVVEMGLDMTIVKWVSRGCVDVVGKAFRIRLAAAFVSFIVLMAVSGIFNVDRATIFILFFYFMAVSLQNVVFSYYRGLEYMKMEGAINALQKIAAIMLLFILTGTGLRKAQLGAVALLGSAILGIVLLVLVSQERLRDLIVSKTNPGSPRYGALAKEGMVLGAVVFVWMIYFRIDSVMLGSMRGNVEVGIYNVAYKIMEGFFFVPSLIMIVFFPKLAREENFPDIFRKLFLLLGVLGLAGTVLLYALSPFIIRTIYGNEFSGSIAVLTTLSGVLLPVFLGHLTTQSLVALDMNRSYLSVAGIGAIINIGLNLMLIPRYGTVGAAWSTFVTEVIVVISCGYLVWREKTEISDYRALIATMKSLQQTAKKGLSC